jgi:hypothetical protein
MVSPHVAPGPVDIAGLRHDLEVGVAVEQHPQAAAHDGVIVREHKRDPLDRRLRGGTRIGSLWISHRQQASAFSGP